MRNLMKYCRNYKLKPMRCFSTQQQQPTPLSKQSEATKPSYFHYIGKNPLVYRNIGQELARATAEYSSTEAIVSCHEVQRRTFTALFDEVNRLAAGFHKLGLQRGDRVAIWGPNTLQWYLTMLGAARAGLISVGINPAFQVPELAYCLKKIQANAIVAPETYKTQKYYDMIASICPELAQCEPGNLQSPNMPQLKAVIIDTSTTTTRLKGAMNFTDCLDSASTDDIEYIAKLQKHISPDSPCNVQFTSGTTGQPKAAMLSHFSYVNNGLHIGQRNELAGQRICVQVPLFHAYGVVITTMAAMSYGATLVLPDAGFNPTASLHAISNENCTVIHGTPTMYVDLVRKQKELQLSIPTAKMAITGGAPCSPQLFLDIKQVLGVPQVRTVYGLTETTAVIFQSRAGDSTEQILHTVGHVQDHVEVKVIDADGNAVPFGQPGELCTRGYVTELCYYDDELKTKEIIGDDKWLRTGDQFILQEDGYGRIVGRVKEMIIRGGENLFPKEIEDFLNAHPHVLESHVIGVPDERMGEELCAFIRLHENITEPITHESLKNYGKGKISHFKIPRYVEILKDFPKTTSGKIQKFKLFEMYKQNQKIKDNK